MGFENNAVKIGRLTRLMLGYLGEASAREIRIDMSEWWDEFPGALVAIQMLRPYDRYKYFAAYETEDNTIYWTIDSGELKYAGKGLAQITLYDPDTKQEYKSRVVETIVAESLEEFNSLQLAESDPASKWVNKVLDLVDSVNKAPYIGENGNWWNWSIELKEYVDTKRPAIRPNWDENDESNFGCILNRTHKRTRVTVDCAQDLGTKDGWQKVSEKYLAKDFTQNDMQESVYDVRVTVENEGIESELELVWNGNGTAPGDQYSDLKDGNLYFDGVTSGYKDKGYKRTYGSIPGIAFFATKVVMIVHREVDGFAPGTYISQSALTAGTFKTISWYDVDALDEAYIPDTIARRDSLAPLDATLNLSYAAAQAKAVGEAIAGVKEDIETMGEEIEPKIAACETAASAATTAAAAANEAAATVGMYSDGYYQGVDLTVKFADEIANYSDPWAWIKARIKAGNYKQINIRDYIPFTTTNNRTFAAQAGGINTYKGYGDTEVGNHIDFITRELWPDTFQMNLIKFNNGVSGDAAIPWLASNGYLYLNSLAGKVPNSTTLPLEMADVDYTAGGVYYYLPTALKDVIVEKRVYAQIRYSASGVLTNDNSGAWVNLGKLWLPDEYEITGARMLSSRGWFSGGLVQYPIFSNSMDRAKSINGNRANWWTSSARADDSGSYVHVGYDGLVLGSAATIKYGVPICFRIA